MAGMQAARATVVGDPTRALGRMTAAFALGQIVGPLLPAVLGTGTDNLGGLNLALGAGAGALVLSAAWLWRPAPVPKPFVEPDEKGRQA